MMTRIIICLIVILWVIPCCREIFNAAQGNDLTIKECDNIPRINRENPK